ncbi:MAG: Gfo/Idh/MocA family oxidoreductase [Bacteroidales bacterium]|nr:Gfo/Idh/MocA family oxidoreductase [Bacteroidales bacterium]
MNKKYNWGILAPGKIAHRFTEGLKLLDNANLHAVGSRNIDRARDFAGQYGYKKYYGTYEELADDPDLEVVYVASPHSHHMEHTLLCLNAGKSVICEKAFGINGSEVEAMIEAAGNNKLFLMEALWPPFQPSYRKVYGILKSGKAGDVITVRSHFAFKPPYEPEKRLYNPDLGGGTLLDIGIYPVIDALTFLGITDDIKAIANLAKTGVDASINVVFGYNNGKSANLFSSIKTGAGVGTDIFCENGNLYLSRMSDGTQKLRVEINGQKPEKLFFNPESRGFDLEAGEVMKCLDAGKMESDVVPLSFSLDLIKTLDRIRKIAGIKYQGRE